MTELERVIEASPRLSDSTKHRYRRYVWLFVEFAGTDPADWTGEAVERWRDRLLETRKPQTVNAILAGLRYASKRLAARTWGEWETFKDFASYAENERNTQPTQAPVLTLDQARAMVAACDDGTLRGVRDMAVAVLGFRTGMRRMSLLGLRFRDLVKRDATIVIKGGGKHTLQLDRETIETLNQWLAELARRDVHSGYVFRGISRCTVDGDRSIAAHLGKTQLGAIMKRRAQLAGVPAFSLHSFRHTFVSVARDVGIPDWRIGLVTGHKYTGDVAQLATYTRRLLGNEAPGEPWPGLRWHSKRCN